MQGIFGFRSQITPVSLPLELLGIDLEFYPSLHAQPGQQLGVNERVRKSLSTTLTPQMNAQFAKVVTPIINDYLQKYNLKMDEISENWGLLKYQNGHFAEHIDYPMKKDGCMHIATQILIPPLELCSYQGGVLEIKDGQEGYKITPKPNQWTFIILPLGILHSISAVKGTRISYVGDIYAKNNEDVTYELPEAYNLERNKVTIAHVKY